MFMCLFNLDRKFQTDGEANTNQLAFVMLIMVLISE